MAYYQIGQTSGTLASAESVFGHDPKSTYAPGGAMVRTASGSIDIVGYARSVWQFAAMDVSTFDSAKTALFSDDGTYSGEGYVETRDDNDDNVASDCVINFPDPRNLRRWGEKYLDVTIEIILLDAGSPIPWGGGALASYATETFVTNSIATHALDNDAHHDPITLASDIDTNLLSLSTQELDLDAQSANEIFAGPTTGGDTKPTFRALVGADIPAATESAVGGLEIATTAETTAFTLDTKIITPSKLGDAIPATPAASRGVRLDASGHLNMPNGGRVVADEVRARGSDGLKLYEDGGKGILVQDSTGYVGVMTSPDCHFHLLEDTSGESVDIKLEHSAVRGSAQIFLDRGSDGKDFVGVYAMTGGSTNWFFGVPYNGGATISDFVIADAGNLASATAYMVFDTSGRMGVGTKNPNEIFEAAGNIVIRVTSESATGALIVSPSSSGYATDPELVIGDASTTTGSESNFYIARNAIWDTGDDEYDYIDTSGEAATKLEFTSASKFLFSHASSGTGAISAWTNIVEIGNAYLDINGFLSLQDTSAPSASSGECRFYSASGEAYVKDDSGNATQLSPHNFSLLGGPSEEMAWSYYSERDGVAVNVDMMHVVREVEKLSKQSLVVIEEIG